MPPAVAETLLDAPSVYNGPVGEMRQPRTSWMSIFIRWGTRRHMRCELHRCGCLVAGRCWPGPPGNGALCIGMVMGMACPLAPLYERTWFGLCVVPPPRNGDIIDVCRPSLGHPCNKMHAANSLNRRDCPMMRLSRVLCGGGTPQTEIDTVPEKRVAAWLPVQN